jgi:outer membrane protein W
MSTKLKKFCRAVSLLSLGLLLTLGAAAPAGAAAHKKGSSHHHMMKARTKAPCKNVLHTLGRHPQSRLLREAPLDTGAKLKRAFNDNKAVVQRVFEEARLGKPVADALIDAVAALPDDARPRDVPVGTKFDWMGYRRHGKARIMFDACWAGKGPFQAWTFSVPGGAGGNVDVIVPVPCGNISQVQPPTCVLNKIDQGDGTVVLDLTGSKAGSASIASYGSNPELPQNPPGRFQVTTPKCEPGANCTTVREELWAEDALGFRSAPGQCVYEAPGGTPVPPLCQLKVTYGGGIFHVDATGTGVAVQSIAVTGNGPDNAMVHGMIAGDQRMADIAFTPTKSGDWTFTSDVTGVNGLHANCNAMVRVCLPPVARLAPLTYNCETRQMGIDATGSSVHQVVTVMPGSEPLSGSGPAWSYGVQHSGTYTVELTADDAICPENKATATATIAVAPFGDTARWTLRAFGAYVRASADDDERTSGSVADLRQKINLGAHHGGFGAGFEYRPLHVCDLSRWGIAVDAIHSELDSHLLVDRSNAWGRVRETVNFTPVLLSLNYHLTPGKPVDLFLGPSIGYAFLDSVTYNTLGASYSEKFDDDLTYGINLGLDVPFGTEHNYAFTAGLRQLFFKAKGSGTLGHNFDLNPTIATAGIAFRFR